MRRIPKRCQQVRTNTIGFPVTIQVPYMLFNYPFSEFGEERARFGLPPGLRDIFLSEGK